MPAPRSLPEAGDYAMFDGDSVSAQRFTRGGLTPEERSYRD
jgi:hypothetical protein